MRGPGFLLAIHRTPRAASVNQCGDIAVNARDEKYIIPRVHVSQHVINRILFAGKICSDWLQVRVQHVVVFTYYDCYHHIPFLLTAVLLYTTTLASLTPD